MIKQFVPQEVCLKCRGCCRFREENSIWAPCLLDEEVQDLLDKKIPPASITAERRIHPVRSQDPAAAFICPFLDLLQNKCKIYDFRPFECQLYPFLICFRDNKILLTVDLNCQYMKQGLNGKGFKEYVDYLTLFLNSLGQLKIFKDNPQILQAYEEVMAVVELKISD